MLPIPPFKKIFFGGEGISVVDFRHTNPRGRRRTMFKASASYCARVCIYPCCPTAFCACKPHEVILTVIWVDTKHILLAPAPEMEGGMRAGPKRCRLDRNGASFTISLRDGGDQHKRFAETMVYASDEIAAAESDPEDDTPLAFLAIAKRPQNSA